MHIPDGMLSTPVVAVTGTASLGFVGYAVAWTKARLQQRQTVLMAVMAALVFALQMLNFPVAAGTSGHFAGGAAAAILLGTWPAVIVMTTVLVVQALLFADGGVLALGANILNMAVMAPFVGYAVWYLGTRAFSSKTGAAASAFAAGWVATVTAALAAGIEIWLSGNAQFGLIVGSMGLWHAAIGIGEGLITAGLVGYVLAVRPDLVSGRTSQERGRPVGVYVTLAVLALAATGISFLASSYPDGLEFVYFEQGIGASFSAKQLIAGPLADYVLPGVRSDALAGVLAGVVGVIVTVALVLTGLAALKQRRSESS